MYKTLHETNNILDSSKFNSLPDGKILDWCKLKAFADNKIKVLKMIIFVFGTTENIVGKGENAGNQHFFLSHNVLKGLFIQGH